MPNESNCQILWLNDDLKVNDESPLYRYLAEMRDESERMGMYIQTCITGDDFISLAKDPDLVWDAFVIDAFGKMSDNEYDPIDILGKVLEKIDELVNDKSILLYCLTTKKIDETSKSSILRLLNDYNFSRTPTGEYYYDYSDYESNTKCISVFSDIKNKLNETDGLFQNYREIEEIYREIKSSNKGTNEATDAIINMLKWHQYHYDAGDFEYGVREIINRVCQRLKEYGFFEKSKIKPGQKGFSSVSGFYLNMMERNTTNDEYLFSKECRWNWEALSMDFLGTMADVAHHSLQKGKGESQDYELFRGMIFNAFVLFSKWYVRFKRICDENGSDTGWMFNEYYFKDSLPCETGHLYQGKLKQTKDKYGNERWRIVPDCQIDTISLLFVDKKEDTSGFSDGKEVFFYLSAEDGNGYRYAISISFDK